VNLSPAYGFGAYGLIQNNGDHGLSGNDQRFGSMTFFTAFFAASSWTERRWHLGQTAGQPTFGTLRPALQEKADSEIAADGDSSNPHGWKTLFFKILI